MSLDIDVQQVIQRLAGRIGELEAALAMAQTANDQLMKQQQGPDENASDPEGP